MSINDDNLDDLDTDTTVHTPDVIQQTNEPITIIPQVPENQNQTTELTDELADKLTKMDVTFKLVEDGVSKVIDMKEVEADILGDEAMDRSKAEDVQAAFESFLSPSLRLNEFTSYPSQTNLAFTKRFMATRIANEQHQVVDSTKQLLEEVDGLINHLKNDDQGYLIELIEDTQSKYISLGKQLKDSKNTVLAVDDKFINIYQADIVNQKDAIAKAVSATFNVNLDSSLDTISDLLQDINFKCFVVCMANGSFVEDIYDNATKAKCSQEVVSASTIVSALSSTSINSYTDYHTETVSYICKELEAMKANLDDICEDYAKVEEYFNSQANVLKGFMNKLQCIHDCNRSIKTLIEANTAVYSILSQL